MRTTPAQALASLHRLVVGIVSKVPGVCVWKCALVGMVSKECDLPQYTSPPPPLVSTSD